MAKRNLFGTDGVRGVVNTQITSKLALSLGAAASIYFDGRLARQTNRTIAIAWDPRVSSEMLAAALGAGFMAVSYTHLRAHETRHDLVCRLLLEKKKTKRK